MWYRLRVVRRRIVFGTIYRRLDGSDWVQVRSWTSAGELSSGTVVFVGELAIACVEDFKLIEGLMLRVEPRNLQV